MKKTWPRALFLGILSSAFFSVTYVLNAAMAQSGGNWMWSASLRYLMLLPMLLVLTAKQGWKPVFAELKRAYSVDTVEYRWLWPFLCAHGIFSSLWP